MIRELILGNLKTTTLTLSLIMVISCIFTLNIHASEIIPAQEIQASTAINETDFLEIEVLPVLNQEYSEEEFIYATPVEEYQSEAIKKEDILRTIPSISTEDNKTLGLLIPPFAYFAKRF